MSSREGILYTGTPSDEERLNCPGRPSEERIAKGPVAVIECVQEIPCNPCEAACPFGAIKVGRPITNLPQLDEEACTGCGVCIAACPGLAIFKIDETYSEREALVEFPYEYYPLPAKGDTVTVVNRFGEAVGKGTVVSVKQPKKFDNTAVIGVRVAKELADQVRGMKGLSGSE